MTAQPHTLSNGKYSVSLTPGGAGRSRFGDISINRWRDDLTLDNWGSFFYVRDFSSTTAVNPAVWSLTYQPCMESPDKYSSKFLSHRAEFVRQDEFMESRMIVVVSPNDPVEIRHLCLTNRTRQPREIDITSFLEVVLAPEDADLSHPAFSNLFIQTSFLKGMDALSCMRRPRSSDEKPLWMMHSIVGPSRNAVGRLEYETDRARFLGRNRTVLHPEAIERMEPLSNTDGAVLDPICSLRRRMRITAKGNVVLTFVTGVADSEAALCAMAKKYQDPKSIDAVLAGPKKKEKDRGMPIQYSEAHPADMASARSSSRTGGIGHQRPSQPVLTGPETSTAWNKDTLAHFNGLGGFTPDGREYVIVLDGKKTTPLPWVNVISNQRFGFQISESGAGYTWSENSRENKLTPWSNDPVTDPSGEVLYLRDDDTGNIWTTTPSPIRDENPYVIRHGQGYSVFEHRSHNIEQQLTVFTPVDVPAKIYRLRLKNLTSHIRFLSATLYVEWVLGVSKKHTQKDVVTSVDRESGALFARNTRNGVFKERVAFVDHAGRAVRTMTGDRGEFIGRHGTTASPAGLKRATLSGKTGAGLDPCGAVQVKFKLFPDLAQEVVFIVGEGADAEEAREILARFRVPPEIERAYLGVQSFWNKILNTVHVETPDTSFNLMLNRWLLYQTLSCRFWSKSAFYQSGGAFGFRDQLQDVRALTYSAPDITREHILRAASRQFVEGDVQHWWHPPSGMGPRTRCSDDLVWLAYVTADYMEKTRDTDILNERVQYVEDKVLEPQEQERCCTPTPVKKRGTLYEHCIKALQKAMTAGERGLPLMGSCDWNDGMNRVGHQGKGESIWMAWFLADTLNRFAPACELMKDAKRAKLYRETARKLVAAIEQHAWDGQWYRRAYMDDGTPLGSAKNPECKIDSLAQTWAVISGAGQPKRVESSMSALEKYLVRKREGLILLLTPPFDQWTSDPGYIKGYVPGVRENGGQYTHAATWVILAFAMMKDGDRATSLFNLINPICHSSTPADVDRYKVEPYVMAADVYGVEPHTGRGGWTWYTGSAAWMYRIGIEWILGLKPEGDKLKVDPCIPRSWPEFRMTYTYKSTVYHIHVSNPRKKMSGVKSITVDGRKVARNIIPLKDDSVIHDVRVVIG